MPLFAFVVNEKVEYIMPLTPGHPVEDKWIAALRSNIIFKDASTNYGLAPGDSFIDDKFYRNDEGNLIEIVKDPAWEDENTVRFAGIIDGEVVGMRMASKISIGEDIFVRFKNAFSSNPLVLELTDDNVEIGWAWDGQNFNPPVE